MLNLNNRLRRQGNLSARNILFSRDDKLRQNLIIQDETLAENQLKERNLANSRKNDHIRQEITVHEGETVMLKENPKKHNIRDTFIVTGKTEGKITMQKLTNTENIYKKSQLRSKTYTVPTTKIFKVREPIVQKKLIKSTNVYTYIIFYHTIYPFFHSSASFPIIHT